MNLGLDPSASKTSKKEVLSYYYQYYLYNQELERRAESLRRLAEQRKTEADRFKAEVNAVAMMVMIELLTGIQEGVWGRGYAIERWPIPGTQVINITVTIMIIMSISRQLHLQREVVLIRLGQYRQQISDIVEDDIYINLYRHSGW